MALTLLLPYLLERQYSASLRFLLALLIVLMLDPLATTDKGFWLSFSAVGILLFFSSSYKNTPHSRGSHLYGYSVHNCISFWDCWHLY